MTNPQIKFQINYQNRAVHLSNWFLISFWKQFINVTVTRDMPTINIEILARELLFRLCAVRQIQYWINIFFWMEHSNNKKLLAQISLCRGLKTREHSEIIQRSIINDSIIQIELYGMQCCLGKDKFFYLVIKFCWEYFFISHIN